MAVEKDLQYRLTADSLNMERGFKSAAASASVFERELAKIEAREARVDAAMTEIGMGMLAAGAAIGAGLGLAAKAAIDWESSWAGVAKVVEGTPAQIAQLEQQIRSLALVLPQSHEEIANVAAAAGQLGVRRQDIAAFTKTMIDLGVATNITAEDAAFALARFMNIMQTSAEDVTRLGSAITQLGNTSATTEADIVAMSLRIAGAGKIIGLSEADVLSYAAALSSVGIEAEAGGSAISRAFIAIDKAVRAGKGNLQEFAKVAGMTADEFREAYQRDAARAIQTFVEGLGRIRQTGGDVFATLEALGFTEIRLRDALLRLSGAGDVLAASLENGNRGWNENTALLQEAERRYQTVEARMQIARNAINDLAIGVGETLLPVIGEAADLASGFADVIGDIPAPIQAVLAVLAALTAALLLAGGTALIAVPKIHAYRQAIETLANSTGRLASITVAASGALGRIGSFLAGPWGIAIGAAVVALGAFGAAAASARADIDELTATLDEQSGAATDASRAWIAHQLEQAGALEAARALGIELSQLVDVVIEGGDAAEFLAARMRQLGKDVDIADEALILYDKNAFTAAETIANLQDALAAAQGEWQRTQEAIHGTTDSVERLDPQTRQLAEAFGLGAKDAKEFAGEMKELNDELDAALDHIFGLGNAQDAVQDAIDKFTEAIKRQIQAGDKNAGSLLGQSKAARENRANLEDVVRAQKDATIQTLMHAESAKEAEDAMRDFKAQMERVAEQLGVNLEELDTYNAAVAEIEREIQQRVHLETKEALKALQTYTQWLNSIPSVVRTRVIAEQRRVGGGVREFALGGLVDDGPMGTDAVLARLTRGEFVVNPAATRENRAALEAANAGAKLAVVGSGRGDGGGGVTNHYEYHIHAATTNIGPAELELLMAQQEARQRAGRPR